jgi:hypothetical protein
VHYTAAFETAFWALWKIYNSSFSLAIALFGFIFRFRKMIGEFNELNKIKKKNDRRIQLISLRSWQNRLVHSSENLVDRTTFIHATARKLKLLIGWTLVMSYYVYYFSDWLALSFRALQIYWLIPSTNSGLWPQIREFSPSPGRNIPYRSLNLGTHHLAVLSGPLVNPTKWPAARERTGKNPAT